MLGNAKRLILGSLFDRYIKWRLEEYVSPEHPVLLDYPVRPEPRYGEGKPPHPELTAIIATGDAHYVRTLKEFAQFVPRLAAIAEHAIDGDFSVPHWDNGYFSGMDAIALYSLLGLRKPARYFEVGSGNSTKFARQAIRDLRLRTEVTSVDPQPRVEIEALCDRQIREPLEKIALSEFDRLQPGDVLFVDNSHRCFQNSDVTVFFMEVLPRLKAGVTVHIHDIFLPFDYPRSWGRRYYSEQYLLAAWLLSGGARLRIVLPLAYCSLQPDCRAAIDEQWSEPLFLRSFEVNRAMAGGYPGTSFWCETA